MNKNIPELRFPEFTGEWISKKLGDVGNVVTGLTYSPDDVSSNGVLVLRSSNIQDSILSFDDNVYVNSTNFNPVIENDILICVRNGSKRLIGKNAIIRKEHEGMAFGAFMVIFRSQYNTFILQLFSTKKYYRIISENLGATINSINNSDLRKFTFAFPSLSEQQKIATFLSAIDDKLQALKKKKALLEQYKKGVMQAIFSQQIRFKDDNGEDYPKWEMKKLGEVCKIYDGTHQTPNYTEIGIPFYSVEHITSNNFSNTKFISHEVFEAENKRVKLEKGDILMTRIGDIGTPKFIDWDVEASFYVSLALIKQSTNNNAFICQFIKSDFFQLELHKRTIHVAFPQKINLGEIGACLIMLPSLSEQTKIANILTAIDEKLTHCQAQIEQTDRYKKGLLQKMFC